MPTDGSGNYSLPEGSTAVSGDVIEASIHNTPLADVAAGMSARVMRNGSAVMTGDLPMGGHRITNLLAGNATGHAVEYTQYRAAGTIDGSGILELATDVEAAAGTDTARAVTAAGVKAYADGRTASAADIWDGTSTHADKLIDTDGVIAAGAYVTANPVANVITLDCATGRNFVSTLNANVSIAAPTNVKVGMVYELSIIQGTGGARIITSYNAAFKFGDAVQPTLSTSEGDEDVLQFKARATNRLVYMGCRKGVQ